MQAGNFLDPIQRFLQATGTKFAVLSSSNYHTTKNFSSKSNPLKGNLNIFIFPHFFVLPNAESKVGSFSIQEEVSYISIQSLIRCSKSRLQYIFKILLSSIILPFLILNSKCSQCFIWGQVLIASQSVKNRLCLLV